MRLLRRKNKRLLILGLDCAGPQLVFDQLKSDLPNISKLMDGGTWGTLESSIPCITVPAWASMTTGLDPGRLGFYGFRNRVEYDYTQLRIVNGAAAKEKRIWDYLGDTGKSSLVISVPQTYPPRPLNGHLVSGFLTPGNTSAFTYPAVLKQEVLGLLPNYTFDIQNFRTEDKADLLKRLYDFNEQQFILLRHMLKSKPWDFAMHVHMGTDRLHHAFWRYHDPQHRLYEPNSPFKQVIRDYYKVIDQQIGVILSELSDDVSVLLVSDHGVTRMNGGICLNEWLWQNGWLVLKTPPPSATITPFDALDVDWSKTRAWGAGGYYGRIFLNIAGREPQGVIPKSEVLRVRDDLAAAIKCIPGPEGQPMDTQVFYPDQIYQQVKGIPPDLLVYFGDLHWRSVGSIGHGSHYTLENDTGPDDANHDTHGIFILHEPGKQGHGNIEGHTLLDIAPTVLNRLGVPAPKTLSGRVV